MTFRHMLCDHTYLRGVALPAKRGASPLISVEGRPEILILKTNGQPPADYALTAPPNRCRSDRRMPANPRDTCVRRKQFGPNSQPQRISNLRISILSIQINRFKGQFNAEGSDCRPRCSALLVGIHINHRKK